MLDFVSSELKVKKGYDDVIDEISAIVDRVETILIDVVNKEVESEAKAAEVREKENKDYIENHVGFYSDTMYGDEVAEGGLSDMDEDFGVYSSVEDSVASMYGKSKEDQEDTEDKSINLDLDKEPSQLTKKESTDFEGFGADDLYN